MQVCGAYEVRLDLAQFAFAALGESLEDEGADQETQHRVSQEFEGFVVPDALTLMIAHIGTVGQRLEEKGGVTKPIAKKPFK